MNKLLIFVVACLFVLLSGCATAPIAPVELDQKAKSFSGSPDKASLYIYRNENFGGAISMMVSINGQSIGSTAAKTYFHFDLVPGKYSIESHAENVSNLSLNLDAGKNYYVWQEVKMGVWMARVLLQQVDDERGRKGVLESKLIAPIISSDQILPVGSSIQQNQPTAVGDTSLKLKELQKLKDEELISEEEYENKRQQLLEKF